MLTYEIGKKIGTFGFLITVLAYLVGFISDLIGGMYYPIVRIVVIVGYIVVIAGFAVMFLNKRDILDFVIGAAIALYVLLFIIPFFSYLRIVMYVVYILMYVPMLLQAKKQGNVMIMLLLACVLIYMLMRIDLLSFIVYGLNLPRFIYLIIYDIGLFVCSCICALYCKSKQGF